MSQLDKIDQKLVAELDRNPIIPITTLAHKIKISQQAASYRLARLETNQTISKFGTIINLKVLGLEHYRIFFTFNTTKYNTNDIFEYLKKQPSTYWAARIGGRYDLLLVLFVKDFEEFDRTLANFNVKFPRLIKDYKACYGTLHALHHHRFLTSDHTSLQYGYNDKNQNIDATDIQILRILKDNCRTPALQIGKQLNINYKTVLNRIRNMEKSKVILGYRLFIKQNAIPPSIILFSYKNYSQTSEQELISFLAARPEVTQQVRLFGIWNLFVHLRTRSPEDTQKFIIQTREKFELIDSYEVIPVFEDITINLLPL